MARLILATTPTDTTPDAGRVSVYAKADKNLYLKDETGLERLIFDSESAAGSGYKVEYFTLDIGDILAKEITLTAAPIFPDQTLLAVDGAPNCFYNLDYIVLGYKLSWMGLRLDGLLEPGDVLQVVYSV